MSTPLGSGEALAEQEKESLDAVQALFRNSLNVGVLSTRV